MITTHRHSAEGVSTLKIFVQCAGVPAYQR